MQLADFDVTAVLGQGSFGKVYLAHLERDPSRHFAIKAIRKDRLISTNQIESTFMEFQILT